MKKILLACMLLLSTTVTLFANSTEETQFWQYVEANKKNAGNPPGMRLVADSKYRIIYTSMPIAVHSGSVTPKLRDKMKKNMLVAIRKEKADCAVIKDLKITIVYAFITSDKSVFTITISYKDL